MFCARHLIKLLPVLLAGLSILTAGPVPVAAAGSGPWQPALRIESREKDFHLTPFRLAQDRQRQRLYVVDPRAGMIFAYDNEGKEVGSFNADGALEEPVAMARGRNNTIWVSERASNQLFHISLKSKQVERYQVRHRDGHLVVADRLMLDHENHIYILDRNGGRILKYDLELNLNGEFRDNDRTGFCDFRLSNNELWALNPIRQRLVVFSPSGRRLREISLDKLNLRFPVAFALSPAGNLYILDRPAGRIVVCDRDGRLRYRFFTPGRYPGHLRYPADLLFDWQGRLCIADEGNGRVEILSR